VDTTVTVSETIAVGSGLPLWCIFLWHYLAYFLILEKVGLWDHLPVCVSVCVSPPPTTFECGPCRIKGETGFFSGCVSPVVARQRLGKHVPAVTKNCWWRLVLPKMSCYFM
jgi:hypothetical protein